MIPVSSCLLQGNEKKYLCEAIDSGEVSGSGRFVREFETAFAKWTGTRYAVAVCNGTCALETAVWAKGMKVINIPTGTIISCFASAMRAGCDIGFRDFGDTLSYRNIMRVHLFGSIDPAQGFNVVDDCSQYWDKFEHTQISCYSLYANKLITAGEGGVIVTNNKAHYEYCKLYRNLGHSSVRFVHDFKGYNFRMSNLQGAVALAQLEQIDKHIEIKQRNRDLYLKYLPDGVEEMFNVKVPWMYIVATKYPAKDIIERLLAKGIGCRSYFFPLHLQPCIEGKDLVGADFPRAEWMWNYAFYLPSGLTLTEKEIIKICRSLKGIVKSMSSSTKASRTKKK